MPLGGHSPPDKEKESGADDSIIQEEEMSSAPVTSTAPEAEDPAGRRRAVVLLGLTLVFGMSTWFSASAVIPQLRTLWNLSDPSGFFIKISVQLG
ncbi:MAG: hypothetical protein M3346_03080, partial [Actinomycetota bacterium]|nr:hypothetical protein [Actinomycetota bacterium]